VKTKKQVAVAMKEFLERCRVDITERRLEASIG